MMSQPTEQLQQTLDQLHEQLAAAGADLDQATQDRLQTALEEIKQTLGVPTETEANDSVVERLREAEIQFEQSHPTLAGTVRRLVDVLAQMGI